MKQKKIPLRSCVITRERLPKQELLRVVRNPEGEVEIDLTGKKNGRGAYIKKDLDVVTKAKKTRALARCLEVEISDSIYEEIENLIKNEN